MSNYGRAATVGIRAMSKAFITAGISAEARPLTGLMLAISFSVNDAHLTEAFPAGSTAFGPAGSKLSFAFQYIQPRTIGVLRSERF